MPVLVGVCTSPTAAFGIGVGTGGRGVVDVRALCLSWWESAPLPQDEDKHKAPTSATPLPLVPTPIPKYLPLKGGVRQREMLGIPMEQYNATHWNIDP